MAGNKFLDYTIKNSLNNDGLVLSKEGGKSYETHLGNFGVGTKENIDLCKQYATLHFMVARPEHFATIVTRKMKKSDSGTYHEYFTFKRVCEKEGVKIPSEITSSDDLNLMIFFNGKPVAF